jgi:hypothetical protein
MPVNLAAWGMHEYNGVLVQPFPNGKAMQVRLEPDRVDVRTREVPVDRIHETEANEPQWNTAYDYVIADWMQRNSPVWQWLKEKGIDEPMAIKRMLHLH